LSVLAASEASGVAQEATKRVLRYEVARCQSGNAKGLEVASRGDKASA